VYVNTITSKSILKEQKTDHLILYSWFRASSLFINKIQQDEKNAVIYLLQNYSTCFGCLSHPSLGVHQTVTVPEVAVTI